MAYYQLPPEAISLVQRMLKNHEIQEIEDEKQRHDFDDFFHSFYERRCDIATDFNANNTIDVLIQVFALCNASDQIQERRVLMRLNRRFHKWTGDFKISDEIVQRIRMVIKGLHEKMGDGLSGNKKLERKKVAAITAEIYDFMNRRYSPLN